MKRRNFLSTMGVLGLSALAPGCKREPHALRIASHVWAGYEFMFLARREGWTSPQDSTLVETGSSTESVQLLATGKVDGAALTLDELLRARERGLPLTAVLVFDVSMGADVLLARPGITALAQLKGKRVGYERSAVGALMLYKALEMAALQASDVKTVELTYDQQPKAWRNGEIDALITFEPLSSHLRGAGANSLFDSSQIPDTIFDVLAVMPSALEIHQDALRRLVAGHFRGLTSFRKNPYDTAYRMAERFQLPPKEVIGAFKGLELPNERRNLRLLLGEGAIIPIAARELAQILARAGILKTGRSDFSNLVSAAFIPRPEAK